jgi:hypothetical protein
MRATRKQYILVGKPEGKRLLGRPRRAWEDNIKTDRKESGWWERTEFVWLMIVTGCCGHGSKSSGSIKGREFLEQLRDC